MKQRMDILIQHLFVPIISLSTCGNHFLRFNSLWTYTL